MWLIEYRYVFWTIARVFSIDDLIVILIYYYGSKYYYVVFQLYMFYKTGVSMLKMILTW